VSTTAVGSDVPAARETHELVRAYYAIPGALRHAIWQVVKAAEKGSGPGRAATSAAQRVI
jgi:hypothetical protein